MLILVKQIVNNPLSGLNAHMLGAFVMLVAVRTTKVAAVRYLKCDITAGATGFGKITAIQALNRIAVVLKSLVLQGDEPPPCQSQTDIAQIVNH